MWIYIASAMPAFDGTVKVGMTGNCYDRLATFNCSSPRPWVGAFLRVYSDPEAWEGEVLDLFGKYRQRRHYGDSEVIYAKKAIDDSFELLESAEHPRRFALLDWCLTHMACSLDYGIAIRAIGHAERPNNGDWTREHFQEWKDLKTRTSYCVPRSVFDKVSIAVTVAQRCNVPDWLIPKYQVYG